MRSRRFTHIVLALWLGLLALTANALEEQQLSVSVVEVALAGDANGAAAPAYHVMPDGRVMMGAMAGAHGDGAQSDGAHGGHTHKGHADCVICGTAAAVAGFTLPPLLTVRLPSSLVHVPRSRVEHAQLHPAVLAAYAARAPPALIA